MPLLGILDRRIFDVTPSNNNQLTDTIPITNLDIFFTVQQLLYLRLVINIQKAHT